MNPQPVNVRAEHGTLSTAECASFLGVAETTLKGWKKQKKCLPVVDSPRGDRWCLKTTKEQLKRNAKIRV